MVEATNQITVSGTIVMINSGRKTSTVQIVSDGGNGKKAFPRFVFPADMTAGYRAGDRATVKAHIHSRVFRKKDGTFEHRQEFSGDEIHLTQRMLIDYFELEELQGDGGYPPDKNIVLISGEIVHIYSPKPDITILTVAVNDGSRINRCDVTCFRRQSDTAQQCCEGDIIAAAGIIQTSIKDGLHHQSMVSRDIAKIS